VHALAANAVPVWAERRFGERVRGAPPEYVITSSFTEWKDANWTFLRPEVIEPWLRDHYRLIWSMIDNPAPLFLWEKR
jgi:hypothetical protein